MNNHWVKTYTKKHLDIFSDKPNFDIIDIAHGLALTCRFGGQGRKFYSVAAHSISLSNIIMENMGDRRLGMVALMHDSPEFILGDIPTPVKSHASMKGYVEVHDMLQKKIFKHFNIECSKTDYDIISLYDFKLAITEAEYLNIDTSDWEISIKPYPIEITEEGNTAVDFLMKFMVLGK